MGYIMDLIGKMPLVILIGSFGFLLFYLIIKKAFKRQFQSKVEILALYLMNLYGVVVLYATFLSVNFFNIGDDYRVNLTPFDWVHTTYSMGISNGIKQFILNIILFIPLGILLPVVCKKFDDFKKIFVVGFLIVLLIEASQLILGRIFDIDDIIANTLGSIVGYCIYSITMDLISKITKKGDFRLTIRKRLSYVGVILIVVLIPLSFELKYRLSEYEDVAVYGFDINDNVIINTKIDDKSGSEKVYKIKKDKSEEELLHYIGKKFNIETKQIVDNGVGSYSIVDESGTVTVSNNLFWSYSRKDLKEGKNLITKDKAVKIGDKELKRLGFNLNKFTKGEIILEDDKVFTLTYSVKDVESTEKYGKIIIRINSDGNIEGINCSIANLEEDKVVTTISKEDALKEAKRFKISPDDYFGGKVSNITINKMENDFVPERIKGHVQPAYKISGTVIVNGKKRGYSLFIPSMK